MIYNAMHRSGVNRCWLREEMIFESSRMLVVGTLRKKMGRRRKRWKKNGENGGKETKNGWLACSGAWSDMGVLISWDMMSIGT